MIRWEGPNKPLWQEWRRCQNLLSGRSDGVPAQMFDLTTISPGPGDSVDSRWTAVLFQQTRIPVFACIPKSWSTVGDRRLMSSVSLDPEVADHMTRQAVADFQKAYELGVPKTAMRSDEDEVRRLFRAPRLEVLLRDAQGGTSSRPTGVCSSRGADPPRRRTARHSGTKQSRFAGRRSAPVSSAVMPIPVAPRMERDRQSRRQSGRSWGRSPAPCSAFSAVPLPLARSCSAGWARPAPATDRQRYTSCPSFFFGSTLGGLLIGTVVGTWLGGRLADRSYLHPPPMVPPHPRSESMTLSAGSAPARLRVSSSGV